MSERHRLARVGPAGAILFSIVLVQAPSSAQTDLESWSDMSRRAVSARQLIGSSVTNGVTPMGMVQDIMLTPDRTQIEYVLIEVPYPVTLWGAEDGFVAFEDVDIARTAQLDLEVRVDEGESVRLPEELDSVEIAAAERLASRLLDRPARFEDGATLQIKNLLINPDTGTVTHYVVETNPEAIIRSARRAVPTRYVEVRDDGMVVVPLRVEELDDLQEFDTAFL